MLKSIILAALILLSSTLLIHSSQAYVPCVAGNPVPGCIRVVRITLKPGGVVGLYGAAPMDICNNSTQEEGGTFAGEGNASSWSSFEPIVGGVPPIWGPLGPGACSDVNWTIRVPESQADGYYEVTWEPTCHYLTPTNGVGFVQGGPCTPRLENWSIVDITVTGTGLPPCLQHNLQRYGQGGVGMANGGDWGNGVVGKSNKLFSKYGCLITSAAMVLNYYAKEENKNGTDPLKLNSWLANQPCVGVSSSPCPFTAGPNGPDTGANLTLTGWEMIADYATQLLGEPFAYYQLNPSKSTVNEFLSQDIPIILQVNNCVYHKDCPKMEGHFVVATCAMPLFGPTDDYSITDPGYWFRNTLHTANITSTGGPLAYPQGFYNIRLLLPVRLILPNLGLILTDLTITADPVDFNLVNPAAKATGVDLLNESNTVDQIPSSSYYVENVDSNDTAVLSTAGITTLEVMSPMSGTYKLNVVANQSYRIDLRAVDSSGNTYSNELKGTGNHTYQFTWSDVHGSNPLNNTSSSPLAQIRLGFQRVFDYITHNYVFVSVLTTAALLLVGLVRRERSKARRGTFAIR